MVRAEREAIPTQHPIALTRLFLWERTSVSTAVHWTGGSVGFHEEPYQPSHFIHNPALDLHKRGKRKFGGLPFLGISRISFFIFKF